MRLADCLVKHKPTVVLSGAGISCGAGIPTYRDTRGNWQHGDPIQHQAFITTPEVRQRYWLRSFAGWPAVNQATPSPTHLALARFEREASLSLIVTQNVDRLHQKAGSRSVIDLHGRLDEVICLDCDHIVSREFIQARLTELNSELPTSFKAAPDGDADISEEQRINVPACTHCGGTLMPNVVFFGGSVDRAVVDGIYQSINNAGALIVVGSSLQVFSGFRFVRFAADQGIPVVSVNPGITRGDEFIDLHLPYAADEIIPAAVAIALDEAASS